MLTTSTKRSSTWKPSSTSLASPSWRRLLGGPKVLPKVEVDKLLDSRARYGVERRNGATPECPVVAEDLEQRGERLGMTRAELVALVDEALKARGII